MIYGPSATRVFWRLRVAAKVLLCYHLGVSMVEFCKTCGRRQPVVWTVPDDLWGRVTGRWDGGGVLCVDCFDRRAWDTVGMLRWTASVEEHVHTTAQVEEIARLSRAHRQARARRARLWPLIVWAIVIFLAGALLASTLTLAISAAFSTAASQGASKWPDGPGSVRAQVEGAAVRAGGAPRQDAIARGESIEARASTTRRTTGDGDRLTSGPLGTNAGGSQLESHARATDTDDGAGEAAAAVTSVPVVAVIRAAALRHGRDPDEMVRVAMCESSLRPLAIGRDQELGIFQIKPTTWEFLARVSGLGYSIERIFDVEAQSEMASWAFANRYGGWWTCRG